MEKAYYYRTYETIKEGIEEADKGNRDVGKVRGLIDEIS